MAYSSVNVHREEDGDGDHLISIPKVKLQSITHLADYLPEQTLQTQTQTNPLGSNPFYHAVPGFYLSAGDVVLRQSTLDLSGAFPSSTPPLAYLRAGPREQIYFEPGRVRAAIVTCGGLCPGMNTVIRELVVGLWEMYGVREIFGIKSGYRGFYSFEPLQLDPKMVDGWHRNGGTMLETSRGGFDLHKIVDAIQNQGFNQVLYVHSILLLFILPII